MAQLVKCSTLGFSSGHDLMVCGFKPPVGLCLDSAELAWDSLSPSLSAPPQLSLSLSLSLSLKINKLKKKKKRKQKVYTFHSVSWVNTYKDL